VLNDLNTQGLLPPALLFTLVITDAEGNIIATNQNSDVDRSIPEEVVQRARLADSMVVGVPQSDQTGERELHFARRFEHEAGQFAGVIAVVVHAGYFVSGYEPSVLGQQGVLGIVGTDGIV